MDALLYIVAGAGVGFAVGLTGIGGGSLMTPLLLLFGFPAPVAIGTDLMYASITKAGGVLAHHRQKSINWTVVKRMAAGSLPAAGLTIVVLDQFFTGSDSYTHVLTVSLGFMLILSSIVLLLRKQLLRHAPVLSDRGATFFTVIMGVLLGVFVTLSSVGAGALGTAILILLYPVMSATRIVGTDLAHAVPLTLAGGLGHLYLGNVDFQLLGALLVGSLPAIYLGTRVGHKLPDVFLQRVLSLLLLGLGIKYTLF